MTAVFTDTATLAPVPRLPGVPTVAVLGMGYVGLPTSLALREAGFPVLGVDISARRLADIRSGAVDLLDRDRPRLAEAMDSGLLELTADAAALGEVDAVIIAVPTPVDHDLNPDLRAVRSACASAVEHARDGQTLILTSTTYVGTTRDLLVEPLQERGFTVGEDIHVAFAPERINPGDALWEQAAVPRVLGGVTPECTEAAARVLAPTASQLHRVSSVEAAEFTKLQENTFRAVNLAFANEMAAAAGHYGIDPVEVVDAAATKPYGYLAHYPGPGVGGHCIPVDPYYLLTPLREAGVETPVVEHAMAAVDGRPGHVADRAVEIAGEDAHILLVGVAYKPGVEDHRESPALKIAGALTARGARVSYHDPLIPALGGLRSVERPNPADYDLVVVAVVHPGHSYEFLADAEHVLDATYKTPGGKVRHAL
jgi:nucleotide sugar dehydrogenase